MEGGGTGKITFQAAPVRKPLLAVSSVNDKGHLVLYDLQGSYVIPSSAPEISQIRELVKKVKGKLVLHREHGVFNLKVWKKKPAFSRQGI